MRSRGETPMSLFQELRLVRAIRYSSLTIERIRVVIQFFNLKIDGQRIDLNALVSNIVCRVNNWCFRVLFAEMFMGPIVLRRLTETDVSELDWSFLSLFTLCWFALLWVVDTLLGWLLFMKWTKMERIQNRSLRSKED